MTAPRTSQGNHTCDELGVCQARARGTCACGAPRRAPTGHTYYFAPGAVEAHRPAPARRAWLHAAAVLLALALASLAAGGWLQRWLP